ncbi:hypothetical protein Bbelb_119890 [Branchiostoma belcheri]|nr:hypothetical protein Bbelb_119890 [Branchiostoma belcheri]
MERFKSYKDGRPSSRSVQSQGQGKCGLNLAALEGSGAARLAFHVLPKNLPRIPHPHILRTQMRKAWPEAGMNQGSDEKQAVIWAGPKLRPPLQWVALLQQAEGKSCDWLGLRRRVSLLSQQQLTTTWSRSRHLGLFYPASSLVSTQDKFYCSSRCFHSALGCNRVSEAKVGMPLAVKVHLPSVIPLLHFCQNVGVFTFPQPPTLSAEVSQSGSLWNHPTFQAG